MNILFPYNLLDKRDYKIFEILLNKYINIFISFINNEILNKNDCFIKLKIKELLNDRIYYLIVFKKGIEAKNKKMLKS